MKLRLMGTAAEVAEGVAALRACHGLYLTAVSAPLVNRGRDSGLVRVYALAGIRSQIDPCHGAQSALWVGETAGPVQLWACRECGGTWTTRSRRPEVAL